MRKLASALALLVLAAVFVTALYAEGTKEVAAKSYVMKVAHSMPTDSTRHQAVLEMEKYIEEKSGGRVQVEIYPAGQLGTEAEMTDATKMGNIECSITGAFDAQTPKLNLYYMPFFFESQADFIRVTKSPIGAQIAKDAEKYGLKLLAVGDAGARHMTNNVRPIRTPADLKGLKMRCPPQPPIIKTMEALGANPVSIPFSETYLALKTGVADGEENPFMNIVTMKFHEVQKYLTVMPYIRGPEPIAVNLGWYNALPADLQKIVGDGGWVFIDTHNRLREETEQKYLGIIRDSGVQIYTPTSAEIKQFRDATTAVADYFINSGVFARDELDAVLKVALSR